MRFSSILPIAVLLTGAIAAKDESTTAVASTTADDKASKTDEASATDTGKSDKDKESKTDKSDSKSTTKGKESASQTSATGPTITWDPPAPKTTIPDINAGSPSPMTPGVVVISLVLGITTLGMALL